MFDMIIVGGGPAGLTAAVYGRRNGRSVLVIEKSVFGGQIVNTPNVENIPGFAAIGGDEFADKLLDQAIGQGAEVALENVISAEKENNVFVVKTEEGSVYEGRTLILATGTTHRVLGLPGEEELLGRGVSYCATCDAPLYRGKTAAVIGYSPREEAEAAFLSEVCTEVLYFPVYKEETDLPASVRVIRDKVTGVENQDGKRLVRTADNSYTVDGVFILREAVSPGQLVPGLPTEGPHVTVNRKMEAGIPGVFACGDIVGTPYQYIKSAGEGNVAALSAVSYLDGLKRSKE